MKIIENSCRYFGSSYNGRHIGTKNLTGINYKSPIIIEETKNIIFFPTTSPKQSDCSWISLKYINISNEISRVNDEKDGMSFWDIVKGTTTIMDHLVDVVDEYTLNTFTNEQLITLKDSCMLQIKNSQHFARIGTSLDLNEEDEQNIHHLKGSAMRLAMMVKQIDFLIVVKKHRP